MLVQATVWQQFRQSVFGDPLQLWESAPDFAELRARWHDDPTSTENVLTVGIQGRDPLAVAALRELPLGARSRERFIALLAAALGVSPTGFHLRAVEALSLLSHDEAWSGEVVRVLLGAGFWGDRREAAAFLARFRPTAKLISAAATAVEDPDYLVRREAACTLAAYAGQSCTDPSIAPFLSGIGTGSAPSSRTAVAARLAALATVHAEHVALSAARHARHGERKL